MESRDESGAVESLLRPIFGYVTRNRNHIGGQVQRADSLRAPRQQPGELAAPASGIQRLANTFGYAPQQEPVVHRVMAGSRCRQQGASIEAGLEKTRGSAGQVTVVVADTAPLRYLVEIRHEQVMERHFTKVWIPATAAGGVAA
jgi:hypothetical protein